MYERKIPQAYNFVLPLMGAAVGFAWVFTRTGTPTTGVWIMMSIAGAFAIWTLFNMVEWIADRFGDKIRQGKELEYKFSPNYRLELVSRMNELQIKAVRAGTQIVEILPGESGPVEKLAGVECYLYTAWYILTNSTDAHVYAINRFQAGTYHFDVLGDHSVDDYRQAKNFHSWLYVHGYGNWGRGNTSMSWNEGWSKEKIMQLLGLTDDTYAD